MVSAQNLISDASTRKYTATFSCYGDGGTGCNIGLPADALMTTPSLPYDAYSFAPTYPDTSGAAANNNNNSDHDNNKVLGRSADNRSILSLGSGNSIIDSNFNCDWAHNHNKSAIMAEGGHQLVVVQEQCSSRTCNSINGDLSSSSNKPTRDEHQREGEEEEEEVGSWLQLGIGSRNDQHDQDESTAENMASGTSSIRTAGSTGLLRLDLNLGGGGGVYSDMPLPARHPAAPNWGTQKQNQQPWGFIRGNHQHPMAMAAGPASSNSSPSPPDLLLMAPPPPNLLLGSHHHHAHSLADTNSSLIRVIDPPPRTLHSGIWFMLLASHPQAKEPFLPQLPKRFLRIKDGRMTVRLVMKYVANKLGLDSESEVEIRCRGQEVEGKMRLQDVRDNIWSARDAAVTVLPNSSTADHIMLLHYGRR